MHRLTGELGAAVEKMAAEICKICGLPTSIYIYGSISLGDFQPGWSDIDILALTQGEIPDTSKEKLLNLRQTLMAAEQENPYYRAFEGAIVNAESYLAAASCPAVYWGTSGQKLSESYSLDVFSKKILIESGISVCGEDIRDKMKKPEFEELYFAVEAHCDTIRKYARTVGRSIKSYGWMLDIARGIYTLQTGDIISKTAAARLALETGLCPVPAALEKALAVRTDPTSVPDELLDYTEQLGADIQRFADVLEAQLKKARR